MICNNTYQKNIIIYPIKMKPNTRRSFIACEDGAFGPCCVGNSATCSYSSGTSTGASLVGHWEGVSGGEDDLRHRHFEYNFYLSFCLRQPCNIKENINNVIYSIKKNWDI